MGANNKLPLINGSTINHKQIKQAMPAIRKRLKIKK